MRICTVWVQMREDELLRLEVVTRDAGVPLLIARSYGLVGYLRVFFCSCMYLPLPVLLSVPLYLPLSVHCTCLSLTLQ